MRRIRFCVKGLYLVRAQYLEEYGFTRDVERLRVRSIKLSLGILLRLCVETDSLIYKGGIYGKIILDIII